MIAERLWCLTLCVGIGASSASAEPESPLSAIDWLSNSVTEDTVTAPPDSSFDTGATAPTAVRVMPLDAPVSDAAGLLAPETLGIPSDLWGRSSAGDLAKSLGTISLGPEAPPVLARFLAGVLQTRLRPPIDAAVDDRFFFARVDRLLEKGLLQAADDLMAAAEVKGPQSFRRRFDVALLTGSETEACRTIESTPDLSPTYPARIFCLARLGEFDVAALTLGNAETLGILTEEEDALLLHFLDPELFEGEPIPPAPPLPTPLQFRLYEAVGERISTEGLPVPFAFADMSNDVGWKARLSAAERLAAHEAIPFERLLAVYEERGPSASGGVWERIRAVTTLARAVEQDASRVSQALPAAWSSAKQAGYEALFAAWALPALGKLDRTSRASHIAFEISLLAEDATSAARFANNSIADQFLLSIATDRVGSATPGDAFGRAILRGLSAANAGTAYESLLADDRQGEALFRALGQLAEGATGNPNLTAQSLTVLRRIGLNDLARQIAVELILREGAA